MAEDSKEVLSWDMEKSTKTLRHNHCSEKIRLDISFELSAWQAIHVKSQALFYPKNVFETSVLPENFSVYIEETRGEILIVRSLKIMMLSMHEFISDQLKVQMFETTNLSCLSLHD